MLDIGWKILWQMLLQMRALYNGANSNTWGLNNAFSKYLDFSTAMHKLIS